MRKKTTRLAIFIVAIAMTLGTLAIMTGCDNGEEKMYNAVLFDRVGSLLNEDFFRENLTDGAWCNVNKQEVTGVPRTRLFTIKSQEKFDEIFDEFPVVVNFDTDMILLYAETTSSIRPFVIDRVEFIDGALIIHTRTLQPANGGPDTASPHTRWTAVRMDKLNFISVEFN